MITPSPPPPTHHQHHRCILVRYFIPFRWGISRYNRPESGTSGDVIKSNNDLIRQTEHARFASDKSIWVLAGDKRKIILNPLLLVSSSSPSRGKKKQIDSCLNIRLNWITREDGFLIISPNESQRHVRNFISTWDISFVPLTNDANDRQTYEASRIQNEKGK